MIHISTWPSRSTDQMLCLISQGDLFYPQLLPSEIYPLSLHDALPICADRVEPRLRARGNDARRTLGHLRRRHRDRKSTRLNSSHEWISYAVFCLKKKNDVRRRREQSDRHYARNQEREVLRADYPEYD